MTAKLYWTQGLSCIFGAYPYRHLPIRFSAIFLAAALAACSNGVEDDAGSSKLPPDDGAGSVTSPGSDSSTGSGGAGDTGSGSSPPRGSDPNDRDGDGLPITWEAQYGLDDNDPGDAFLDSDGDFLINRREFVLNLDPQNADSDGDRVPDGVEVDIETDPALSNGQTVVTVCANGCDFALVSAALAAGNQYILVKPGQYDDNIVLGNSRHVFSEAGAENTVINSIVADHVVHMSPGSSLHGFTISGGKAALGGGVFAAPLAVTIRANIIAGNQAVVDANNLDSGYGGGIYVYSQGNAAYSVRIEGNEIRNNTAVWGAGIDLSSYSYAVVSGNRIHDNLAIAPVLSTGGQTYQALGGGVFLSEYAYAYCFNNVIYANEARDGKGGGIYSGYNNTILNNTIVGNSAQTGSGLSSTSVLIGNIIWGNIPVSQSVDAALDMYYSIVNGGFSSGMGNVDSDPLFVSADTFDFRLQKNSPAIDIGSRGACTNDIQFVRCLDSTFLDKLTASGIKLNKDFRGADRALDGDGKGAISGDSSDYDIGAFEYMPPPS